MENPGKYYFLEANIPVEIENEVDESSRSEFLCQGIEEFSIEEAKVDEILGERSYSGGDVPESVIDDVVKRLGEEGTSKKFFFLTQEATKKFQSYLKEKFNLESEVKAEDIKDWNTEWRKSYQTIKVGEHFSIIPEWEKPKHKITSKNLFIYPGQGFGTGSHETTFLCMKLYFEMLVDKSYSIKTCLDFGCGSGILGLATLKVNPSMVVDLYDIDKSAIENSKQNIDLNELQKTSLKLLLPNDRAQIGKKYDLVFANILQNILLLETELLSKSLERNGHLILSGLLKGQEEEVIKKYLQANSNLVHVKTEHKGDWVAVLLRTNS